MRLTDRFPRPNTGECVAVLGAVAFSPFWFINFFGVNFGPADALLVFAFLSYFYRTRIVPVLPSRLTAVGLGLFLVAGAIGVVISPVPVAGLVDYLQYVYIFLVAIPIAFVVFDNERMRAYGFLTLVVALNSLMIVTNLTGFTTGIEFEDLTFNYGNQNQLYWLVASAFVLDICLAANDLFRWSWRIAGLSLAILCLVPIVLGLTLSAILIVGGATWLVIAWYITRTKERRARYGRSFGVISAVAILGGLAFITLKWELVYSEGSLETRTTQYSAALSTAIKAFPFGTGMASDTVVLASLPAGMARSVHNYFLAYFMQIGLAGAVGFTLVLVAWLHRVLLTAYSTGQRAFEFAPVAIFAMYIVVILFQPVPVRRFWWLLFALSWGAYQPGGGDQSATPLTNRIRHSLARVSE